MGNYIILPTTTTTTILEKKKTVTVRTTRLLRYGLAIPSREMGEMMTVLARPMGREASAGGIRCEGSKMEQATRRGRDGGKGWRRKRGSKCGQQDS
jgi:hypothetical protein